MKTLQRKNIMIDGDKWETLKMLSEIEKDKSISNIISIAVDRYIRDEISNNLAFKLRMIAQDNYVSQEEEEEIIADLKNMSDDELEPAGKLDI